MSVSDNFKHLIEQNKAADNNEIQNDDEDNDIKTLRQDEPLVKGVKKRYVYYVVFALMAAVVFGSVYGLSRDTKTEKKVEKTEIKTNNIESVQGNHLLNIPKDYSQQAEFDRKNKEKSMKEEIKNKDSLNSNAKKSEAPSAPKVPKQPTYNGRRELSPEEKAKLMKEELRQKALQSPIGFELRNME